MTTNDPKGMTTLELIAEARAAQPGDILVAKLQLIPLIRELASRLEAAEAWRKEAAMVEREIAEFGHPMQPDHNHHEIRDWLAEAFEAGRCYGRHRSRVPRNYGPGNV